MSSITGIKNLIKIGTIEPLLGKLQKAVSNRVMDKHSTRVEKYAFSHFFLKKTSQQLAFVGQKNNKDGN